MLGCTELAKGIAQCGDVVCHLLEEKIDVASGAYHPVPAHRVSANQDIRDVMRVQEFDAIEEIVGKRRVATVRGGH